MAHIMWCMHQRTDIIGEQRPLVHRYKLLNALWSSQERYRDIATAASAEDHDILHEGKIKTEIALTHCDVCNVRPQDILQSTGKAVFVVIVMLYPTVNRGEKCMYEGTKNCGEPSFISQALLLIRPLTSEVAHPVIFNPWTMVSYFE